MEDIEIAYYDRSHDIFSLLSPYQIPAHRFPNIAEHFRQQDDILLRVCVPCNFARLQTIFIAKITF